MTSFLIDYTRGIDVSMCGGVTINSPHSPTGSGIIRRYGLLEEVRHCVSEL